jgi:DNA repair photolyase
LRTQVFEERAKSILTRNQSPDIPFSVSLNPYRGCEHGCIYCFARPTHSYLGLSPGLDFESRIYAKVNAAELLEREIARKRLCPSRSRSASTPTRISRSNAICASRAA